MVAATGSDWQYNLLTNGDVSFLQSKGSMHHVSSEREVLSVHLSQTVFEYGQELFCTML